MPDAHLPPDGTTCRYAVIPVAEQLGLVRLIDHG
jgi:hypothetical protein